MLAPAGAPPIPYQDPQMQAVKADLASRLQGLLIDCRDRRRSQVEQQWLWNHAAWMAKPIHQQYKSDQFAYYIPAARHAVEHTVRRGKQMLLPSPQFFEVYPGSETDVMMSMQADAVRAYMTYVLSKRVKIGQVITMLLRNLCLYDRAITKTTIKLMRAGGQVQIWPHVRVVDPFTFYVWPETAVDREDWQVCFEDHMMPWSTYQTYVQAGVADPVSREQLNKAVWPDHHIQRLAHQGLSDPSSTQATQEAEKGEPFNGFMALSEVWMRSTDGWLLAWLLWNCTGGPKVVRLQPSAYPEPPYRDALARPMAGEQYTHGFMSDIEQLQVWLNDSINLMEDARSVSTQPPIAIGDIPRSDGLVYGPRKLWKVNGQDISVVPLPDTSKGSLMVAQMVLSEIQQLAGSAGMSAGQPGRNAPRAGFAVNNLINLGMADHRDLAEIIELECLDPTLADIYTVSKIFIPPQQIMMIPGTDAFPPQQLGPMDLFGDWTFRWVGSLQAQDAQMRAQKLTQFGALAAQIAPIIGQMGYTVEWADLLRMIWREGMGERGLNQIIRPLTPEEIQQMMLMQQMQQAQAAKPEGSTTKTTTRNGPGGSKTVTKQTVPGTPEEATRQQGVQLSMMSGGGR